MKSFREYLAEAKIEKEVNEANINTFKMGKYEDRESIKDIPSKIKGKITIDLDILIKNATKYIYENGTYNGIEMEYDRKSIEEQIKLQIDKLLSKELKIKNSELDSGGSSALIGFINSAKFL